MNECPFCGMHLDCKSDDIWICQGCDENWIRRKSLEPSISQLLEVTNMWDEIKRKADEINEKLKK